VKLNTPLNHSLPNTLNVSFPGIFSDELIHEVRESLAISAGSACHSGARTLSTTLKAMGMSDDLILGAVRFSTGKATTSDDIVNAVQVLNQAVHKLRAKH
jgi:cysteine desulfurase